MIIKIIAIISKIQNINKEDYIIKFIKYLHIKYDL